jgi:hypothetical protein
MALLRLRHIRADLSGRPPGTGLFRQATGVAVGMGISAVMSAPSVCRNPSGGRNRAPVRDSRV